MKNTGINPETNPPRGSKTIRIPFESEAFYEQCINDDSEFRKHLEHWAEMHPELFPPDIEEGFIFYGSYYSRKQKIFLRRIQMKSNDEVYQVHPSSVMPYMTARTDDVEKALFLLRWIPLEALTYVFGRDEMYWYRMILQFSRPSMVGTTIKDNANLSRDLLGDEKHTRLIGERIYAATTVAGGCFLGIAATFGAGTDDLQKAYGEFAAEARELDKDYCPETVGTDGWGATDAAWRNLFPSITVILCFLHSILKLKNHCRSQKEWMDIILDKAWKVYSATTRSEFLKRFRRLRYWAKNRKGLPKKLRKALLTLGSKAKLFAKAYDFPGAYRTSNAVDRLMDFLDRKIYAMKYFHGTIESARAMLRAHAMIWNFHPYGARLRRSDANRISPAVDLNGKQYHENWLHNFLISASLGGRRNLFVNRK